MFIPGRVAGLGGRTSRARWLGGVGPSGRAGRPGRVAGPGGRAGWPGLVAGPVGRAGWPVWVAGLGRSDDGIIIEFEPTQLLVLYWDAFCFLRNPP